MTCNCTWFCKYLSTNDLVTVNTTEKSSDVITSHSFIKLFSEHFDTSNNCLKNIFLNTKDFKFIIKVKCSSFYSTCSNSTTTCDCEYVFYWHKEWLICISYRIWDIFINCVHKFKNLITPFTVRIFKCFKS